MKGDTESETNLPSQVNSPAQDNRSEGRGQDGVGVSFQSQTNSPAQNHRAEEVIVTAAISGKPAANVDVNPDEEHGRSAMVVADDSSKRKASFGSAIWDMEGGGQDVVGNSDGIKRPVPLDRTRRDVEGGGQFDLSEGDPVVGKSVGDGPSVPLGPPAIDAVDEGCGGQFGSGEWHKVVGAEKKADLTQSAKKEKSGGQGAPVISSTANYHRPRSTSGVSTAGGELIGSQVSSRLKSILPQAPDGWWEVRDAGQGVSFKFRWRDQKRHTLAFPRITGNDLRSLMDATVKEAGSMIRLRITMYLHELTSNPAKRDKALAAAEKLGMDIESYQTGNTNN